MVLRISRQSWTESRILVFVTLLILELRGDLEMSKFHKVRRLLSIGVAVELAKLSISIERVFSPSTNVFPNRSKFGKESSQKLRSSFQVLLAPVILSTI